MIEITLLAITVSISRDRLQKRAKGIFYREKSKALEPEWNAAIYQYEDKLLSIDCTVEKDLCREHEIVSYPAIRLYQPEKGMIRYKGPRIANE